VKSCKLDHTRTHLYVHKHTECDQNKLTRYEEAAPQHHITTTVPPPKVGKFCMHLSCMRIERIERSETRDRVSMGVDHTKLAYIFCINYHQRPLSGHTRGRIHVAGANKIMPQRCNIIKEITCNTPGTSGTYSPSLLFSPFLSSPGLATIKLSFEPGRD